MPGLRGSRGGRFVVHRRRKRQPDPLGRGLGIPVGDMCVAHGHRYAAVAEQLRDHRQRHAVQDRLAREGMAQVVQADILQPGPRGGSAARTGDRNRAGARDRAARGTRTDFRSGTAAR